MSIPPNIEIKFNKKAQADIREITAYLLNLVGPEQTLKTMQQINARFRYLAENPRIGIPLKSSAKQSGAGILVIKSIKYISGVPAKTKSGY